MKSGFDNKIDLEYENVTNISERTILRLRKYLYILNSLIESGKSNTSSAEIADRAGIKSGLVRKDLSQFGGFGRPSVGYNIQYLRKQIKNILGTDEVRKIILIASDIKDIYEIQRNLEADNFSIHGIFADSTKYPIETISESMIYNISELEYVLKSSDVEYAIILDNKDDPQSIANKLTECGIKYILNLTYKPIMAFEGILIKNLDISSELITLSFNKPAKSKH